jgi:hypothetical protein
LDWALRGAEHGFHRWEKAHGQERQTDNQGHHDLEESEGSAKIGQTDQAQKKEVSPLQIGYRESKMVLKGRPILKVRAARKELQDLERRLRDVEQRLRDIERLHVQQRLRDIKRRLHDFKRRYKV